MRGIPAAGTLVAVAASLLALWGGGAAGAFCPCGIERHPVCFPVGSVFFASREPGSPSLPACLDVRSDFCACSAAPSARWELGGWPGELAGVYVSLAPGDRLCVWSNTSSGPATLGTTVYDQAGSRVSGNKREVAFGAAGVPGAACVDAPCAGDAPSDLRTFHSVVVTVVGPAWGVTHTIPGGADVAGCACGGLACLGGWADAVVPPALRNGCGAPGNATTCSCLPGWTGAPPCVLDPALPPGSSDDAPTSSAGADADANATNAPPPAGAGAPPTARSAGSRPAAPTALCLGLLHACLAPRRRWW